MISHFIKNQNGNAFTQFALSLPILIGVVLMSADLYNINQMRGIVEESSHNLASILSNQQEWNINSFNYLVEQALETQIRGEYGLVVSKVNLDRSMEWQPINRGDLAEECTQLSSNNAYSASMPEEDEDIDNISLLVVQLCRYSDDLIMNSGLLGNKLLESISINRLMYHDIKLDQDLSKEVGVEYDG